MELKIPLHVSIVAAFIVAVFLLPFVHCCGFDCFVFFLKHDVSNTDGQSVMKFEEIRHFDLVLSLNLRQS